MNSAKAVVDLIPFFLETLKRIFEAVEGLGTDYDARSLEAYVMAQCKALGTVMLELALQLRQRDKPAPLSWPCDLLPKN